MTPGKTINRPVWSAYEFNIVEPFIPFWEDGFLDIVISVCPP